MWPPALFRHLYEGFDSTAQREPIRRVSLRGYLPQIIIVLVMLACLTAVNMAVPYALKLIVDRVLPGQNHDADWPLIWPILGGIAIAYILRNALFFSSRMMSVAVAEDLSYRLRSELFGRLQEMSVDCGAPEHVGEMSSRVMDDTSRLQQFIEEHLPKLLFNLITFTVLMVVIFVINWRLAVATVLLLPLHFLTFRTFNSPMRHTYALAQNHLAEAHGAIVERLMGMEVVKGFTAEKRERRIFDSSIAAVRRSFMRSQLLHVGQKVIADLLIGAATIVLLGFGAWQVVSGVMTTGEFFMYLGYAMMLYPTVLDGLSSASHLARARVSADRVNEVLASRPAELISTGDEKQNAAALVGRVVFDKVGVGYGDEGEILTDVSFVVEPGERVAISGPSGIGKTSLANLIPAFHSATSGRVLIDDRPVNEWPLAALRAGIGVAFQEVFLFNCSLWENVLYGRTESSVHEVIHACKVTGAHDFIDRLPIGYATTPGAMGTRFSRGERQRITLARAILKSPRILIMDEATSSLDPEAGTQVIKAVFEALPDSTIILITHDPAIWKLADRVIHLAAPLNRQDSAHHFEPGADRR
jgi:ABC-type multidrug transport system fused ATPase/permease subunit